MAKASATITVSLERDISSVTRYYKLQASTASAPAKPTTLTPSGWTTTEPAYTEGSTNSLYFTDCTVFTDGTFSYSDVSLSSSYEAAKAAYNRAVEAAKVATNYISDSSSDGFMVHPENDSTTGWKIKDALEMLKSGVSFLKAWVEDSVAKVRVGREDAGHTIIDSNGMRVYGGDGTELLANIGYGEGTSQSGATEIAPYYIFGVPSYSYHGNYSMVEGYQCDAPQFASHAEGYGTTASGFVAHAEGEETIASGDQSHAEGIESEASGINAHAEGCVTAASGDDSHAEGFRTVASGDGSHAGGCKTIAAGEYQTSIGKYNIEDTNDTYAFIVGNGNDDNNRSNALTVDWSGSIDISGVLKQNGKSLFAYEDVQVSVTYAAGTIGARGASVSLGTTVKTGYTYIGAVITDHRNTSVFSATVVHNGSNNTAHLAVYRATGNAASNLSVIVRKVWVLSDFATS